jgi:type II secretory pathway pseudopilin PulG
MKNIFKKITSLQKKKQAGFSLIELLLTIGLITVFLPALLIGFSATREGRPQMEQRMKATALAREGEEAVRVAREDWTQLETNGTFHPDKVGNTWKLLPNSLDPLPGFHRSVVISDIYRDASGNVVPSTTPLSTLDQSTKKITVTVSWDQPRSSSVTSSFLLTRYGNTTYTETSQTDFQRGTYGSSIGITNTSGGEVTLGTSGGASDWCAPTLSISALDLTRQSIPTAISASYKNAYTATGFNSSGETMDHINITDVTYPASPSATEAGSYNNFKSYGLFADPGTQKVYLTSDHPGMTVDIVNGTNNAQIATFAASGGENGVSVYVSGTTGYVTTEKSNGSSTTLYSFDTTTKPAKELGKISLVGSGKRIIVIGQYAYVVTSNTTKQLQIIDVSNPKSMTAVATMNMGNGAEGVDISLDAAGTTAYLVTKNISGKPDAYILNLTTRTITKSYTTGSMVPNSVAFVPGGWMIVVGSGSPQYQVFRTTSGATSPCGSLSAPNGASTIYAVDYIEEPDGDVFSYILTNNTSKEFQMIQGGPGAGGGTRYVSSGEFTSGVFNAGYKTAFNSFSAVTSTPSGTSISFKIAVKNAVSGSCSAVVFNDGDFIPAVPGPLALGTNIGQCMKYKVILTTSDSAVTPTLFSITFNYSL